MDVVSDVIATMRVGRARFRLSHREGEWGNRFGPYPGAGFHIVLRGSCWLLPPEGAATLLSAGDVVFLPHGAVHGMSSGADREAALLPLDPEPETGSTHLLGQGDAMAAGGTVLLCGAYRIDRGQVHPFLRALPEVVHLPAGPDRHPALAAVVELLAADLAHGKPGADAALPALLDLLLVHVLRAWLEEESAVGRSAGWCAALADPAVAAALNHLHRRPAHPWTVHELAREVGLSRTALARRFTQLVGRAPMAYLTWWRLSSAARILRDTQAPLSAVAAQVGYTSEFAFANAFKRQHGLAPGRFRRTPNGPPRVVTDEASVAP
ncbi:AraC family transcriptional regulator [Streptomyces sp. NPDC002779]|uniref:AraC family transcriptional regulator n=1 Tax=Streptomyces sp. NPDC002779 TaxID=3364664 RepID=UPI0036745C79